MFYDKVFVHAAQMIRVGIEYIFLPEDHHGFLHGEIRVEAVKVLRKQRKVKEIIVVGGPTPDGASKAKLIAAMIGGIVTELESIPSTQKNIEVIKNNLINKDGRKGLLTNFYHLPRAMRFAAEKGLDLIPICAEAVLLTDDPGWTEKIKSWYSQDSMLVRIISEIKGLSDLESMRYK